MENESDEEITQVRVRPTGDMKTLRNRRESRPELSITPYNGQVHGVRATEYGADKYARGNYFGPPPANVDPVDRFAEYISAAQRHLGKIAQAINVAKGTGGDQRAACAVVDDEASGGFPPSMLPHVAHAIAGLMIAVECGVSDGLLPADPAQPWKRHPMYDEMEQRRGAALAQKDDPDAEHSRVRSLLRVQRKDPADPAGPTWSGPGVQAPEPWPRAPRPDNDASKLDQEIAEGFGDQKPDEWPGSVPGVRL